MYSANILKTMCMRLVGLVQEGISDELPRMKQRSDGPECKQRDHPIADQELQKEYGDIRNDQRAGDRG